MRFKLLCILLIPFLTILAQEQTIDKVIAVVDNEVILQSELQFQVQLLASQKKISPTTPGLQQQVLKAMIDDKLVYAQANIDSVFVTDEEVDSRLDYQINMFTQQYGSREKVEQAYGMTIDKIRRDLRDDIRKSLMTQKLQEKNFGMVEASRREVEEFYNKYKDSIGVIPEKVKIGHIYRNPKSSSELKHKYYELASSLLDSIKAGSDFAELAKKYSQDPGSAEQGGDLGFVKKGVFYPEFESAAFALSTGQLSGVVETPVGYHIIQLLEKRGEAVHARHILIKIKNDEQADLKTIEFLTDLRDSLVRYGASFSDMAKKYSEDNESKVFGGELGTFYYNQIDKSLYDIVAKMKEGEISFPRRIEYGADNYGYHIVKVLKKIPQHAADIEQDFTELKKLADDYKKQNLYEKWIEELRNKIFYEVRL